jgi:hypothetical protein
LELYTSKSVLKIAQQQDENEDVFVPSPGTKFMENYELQCQRNGEKEKREMRRFSFIVFLLIIWLATCSGPKPKAPAPVVTPTQTQAPATATPFPPTPTETAAPQGKLPGPPFDAQVYASEAAGFALDYPTGWTVNEQVVGPRGTQILFLSQPELAEAATIPAGETRVAANIYLWDPKNDLAAYVQHMKEAWSASGFTILDEQQLTLEQGLPAELFTVQTPDTQVLYLIAALKDQYLVISGEGDLDLAQLIVERVRPIS